MENTDAERLLSERRHGGHDQQFERAMDNTDAERLLASDPLERRPDTDIRQYRSIYWTRLILRVLSFATCIAILYYLITGILVYKRTKDVKNPYVDGSGSFDVWPPGLKLWPSYILLGAALGAAVLNLILLFASCFKKVRHMTKTGNVMTMVTSTICLVLWVTVTAYYHSWDTKTTAFDLLSWTCTHTDPKYDYKDIDFSEMCTELRFAFWGGVALAGLEAFNLLVFVLWWFGTRKSRGYKRMAGKDSMNLNFVQGLS